MAGQRELEERRRQRAREAETSAAATAAVTLELFEIINSGDALISAEEFAGGLIERDPGGADRTDTTDDADALVGQLGLVEDGYFFECAFGVIPSGGGNISFLGGSGVTVFNPERVVEAGEVATLLFFRETEANVILYIKGGV